MPAGRLPFGIPAGPTVGAGALLRSFVEGATAGRSSGGEFHIEGALLMAASFVPLAIRLEGLAFLLRADVPPDVAPLRGDLERSLRAHGITAVEGDPPLSQVVGIEVTGQRGAVWDLWGRGPREASERLRRRAAGELGPLLATMDLQGTARIDRTIAEMEQELR